MILLPTTNKKSGCAVCIVPHGFIIITIITLFSLPYTHVHMGNCARSASWFLLMISGAFISYLDGLHNSQPIAVALPATAISLPYQ